MRTPGIICQRIWLVTVLLAVLTAFTVLAAENPTASVTLSESERQWLQAHPVITLAPDPDFKPIEFFDKNGTYQGAAADIIRILEKKLGITITIARVKNWDEAMAKFKSHEVDLLGAMVKTPNREKFALFSDTIVTVPGGIFARSGSPANLALNDLKGKKVAVVSNYTAHDVLKEQYPEIILDVVPDVQSGLAKASLGMVDAYVENMANATFYSQEAGITNLYLAGTTDFAYRWGIGIRKDWPELQTILNKGLAAISEEERNLAIQRWIFIEGQQWRPGKMLIIGTVASSLAALLLLVSYWNYRLRNEVLNRTISLQRELDEREKAEAALKDLAGQLEEKVRERTAQLQQEIAERIRSEQAAVASEQRFKELFQNVADPIYIADTTGRIIAANDQACRELDYTLEELLHLSLAEVDARTDISDFFAANLALLENNKSATFESSHRRKDGSVFPVELNVCLIDLAGQQAVMGVARNITKRKKIEIELLHAKTEAESASRTKSQFLATMSHEIRTPMNGIIGIAQLLERSDLTQEQREYVEILTLSSRNLLKLISDILDLSRIEAGRIELETRNFDLKEEITGTANILSLLAQEKGLELGLLIDPDVPLLLKGDADRLRQIITNLVGNAIKFSTRGTISLHISNDAEEVQHATLRFQVRDSGIGIASDTIGKIFEAFSQADSSTRRKFGGTGLGLTITRHLVELMGGSVAVESTEGEGATFWFTAVLEKQPKAPDVPALEKAGSPGGSIGTNVRILLVEDDAINQFATSRLLSMIGYRVDVADNGSEGLKLLEENDYSLVLMDCMMPVLDGYQATAAIRDPGSNVRNHAIPVIALTANAMREDREKCLAAGMDDYLSKPAEVAALLAMLEKWLTPG